MKFIRFIIHHRKNILFGLGILALIIGLMILVYDVARQTVAVQISYLLWLGDLTFRIISQVVLWTIFLAIVCVIIIRSLLNPRPLERRTRTVTMEHFGRVQALTRLIRFAEKWSYSRWNLAHHLAELESEILALHGHGDPRELQKHLRDGEIDADEDIRAYFQFGLSRQIITSPKSLWKRVKERFYPSAFDDPTLLDPERIVTFLEHQLELPHE